MRRRPIAGIAGWFWEVREDMVYGYSHSVSRSVDTCARACCYEAITPIDRGIDIQITDAVREVAYAD